MPNKQNEIISMFDDIAPTYNKANRMLSLGIDISWRKEACKKAFNLLDKKQVVIADIACGTGDMIGHWLDASKEFDVKIDSLYGIDPSSGMLEVAKQRFSVEITPLENLDSKKPSNMESNSFITLALAKAQDLPLESNSFDIISIAYGLRNVVDRKEALQEFYRVLKPGGVLVILEFTNQKSFNPIAKILSLYTRYALPLIGGLISRNFKAYKYLPSSIKSFVTKQSLQKELDLNGFKNAFAKSYSANISTLIIAKK